MMNAAMLFVALAVPGQSPSRISVPPERVNQLIDQAITQELAKLNGRLDSIERRVGALEGGALLKEKGQGAVAGKVESPVKEKEESYGAAYQRALRSNKPFLVWIGGNFCPT